MQIGTKVCGAGDDDEQKAVAPANLLAVQPFNEHQFRRRYPPSRLRSWKHEERSCAYQAALRDGPDN